MAEILWSSGESESDETVGSKIQIWRFDFDLRTDESLIRRVWSGRWKEEFGFCTELNNNWKPHKKQKTNFSTKINWNSSAHNWTAIGRLKCQPTIANTLPVRRPAIGSSDRIPSVLSETESGELFDWMAVWAVVWMVVLDVNDCWVVGN